MIPTDWIMGLIGGLMIGGAGALFLLANGKIMGASGIAGSLIDGTAGNAKAERIAFVAGLIIVPAIFVALKSEATSTQATSNIALLIGAGLCVGIGTRLANGCTSGHGVCGISRLSPRGIVATILYILAGGLTVVALRAFGGMM